MRYVQNVLAHIHDAKYRTIQMSNSHLKTKVLNLEGALQLLELLGFVEQHSPQGGKQLFLIQPDTLLLREVSQQIESSIASLSDCE